MKSGDIDRIRIYMENRYKTYIEKRYIWNENIYGVKIYTKRRYRTYTKKLYIWSRAHTDSEDIYVE